MKNKYVVSEENRIKLGKYIREVREKRGLGLNQLAVKISVVNSLLSKLENGLTQKISPFLLKEVANGLRIDYKELYKIVDYLEEAPLDEIDMTETMPVVRIPLYESISAGCGNGNDPATPIDYVIIPELKNAHLYYSVKVEGDSMEPTIKNHSIIVIKRDESIPDGSIGAFIIDGGAVVKRIRRTENENILISDNNTYMPIILRDGDVYHECGKVVKVISDL